MPEFDDRGQRPFPPCSRTTAGCNRTWTGSSSPSKPSSAINTMTDSREYLRQTAAARRAAARARQAIRQLDQSGHLVNFRTVAIEAGVSRSWLYREPTIRA
jgi:hypothetical protein